METQWEHLHPLPDPDDNDPYARVNALTVLREPEGLIGDLRDARVIEDRSIGLLTVRAIEVALGLAPARADETEVGRGQVSQMMSAAAAKSPDLATGCLDAVTQTRALIALVNDKLGPGAAPDLRPITVLVNAVSGLLPSAGSAAGDAGADDGPGGGATAAGAGGGAARQGLSGSVTTREEAMRAIDLVCEFLERSEPTNPAPLFLRRGRQLIGHNFLQLLKALAPNALSGVAEMVGVDPDEVESPGGS
jgi:type VI secretion system protein ImpA